MHSFHMPLEQRRQDLMGGNKNSAQRKRSGALQSPFIFAIFSSLSVHTNWGFAGGLVFCLCGPTVMAWSLLLPSLRTRERTIAFCRCQVTPRSLPACLTPESPSDGYSDSSFGGGQLAGARRHMVTSPLPKKQAPVPGT